MTYKIITDSSSNLTPGFYQDEMISFDVAPLSIRFGDKEYIDDGSADIADMLKTNHETKEKGTTSCPAPNEYLKRMTGADYYILIAITSKLSGSYNSANVAKSLYAHPENVIVIDSLSALGSLELIARKAIELIHQGEDFSKMEADLLAYRDSTNLLFVIYKYDNFIKSGRVNKIIGFLASKFKIKPLAEAKGGEIHLKEKVRTIEGITKRIIVNIGLMCPDTAGKTCIISHTFNEKDASALAEEIKKTYAFKEVVVRENRALCAYYSLEGALTVAF
ncbi:MAG: DegV family protein [Bacilli bacterium]|jgi:DegV family protein with EDD domain|nr:DegV family protein [Bacilli bacterium]